MKKTDKSTLKLRTSSHEKTLVREWKSEEYMFAIYVTDKSLISRIHKVLKNEKNQNSKNQFYIYTPAKN